MKYKRYLGDAWVLTAAHCFRKYSHPENNSIIVGAYQFKNDGYLHEIAEIIIHPQVELLSRNAHDIAILRSKINFKLNEYHVYPIALPKRASKPGEVAIISGWGLTKVWHLNVRKIILFNFFKLLCSIQWSMMICNIQICCNMKIQY